MVGDKRLYKSIVDKILLSIESGEFPTGGRLPPERELAERYDVSRPTIREAIIALEALERVEVKTGSGIYVLESTTGWKGVDSSISPFELTEARAMIEGEAAALAAVMMTNEQLAELEIALNEMASSSPLDYEQADKNFHQIIARATGNKMLNSMIENLWYVRDNSPSVHRAYQAICAADGKERVREHVEIFEALKNRDDKSARTAMHQHFSRIINKLIVTTEKEQVEAIQRKMLESRERFSLNHLVSSS
ncbi:FadR family transcriptional regulator [Pseudomonadales bacterium]|nr:FadR family transcriptional regulator [Pseudomonadales bacterium]MDB4035112.1 FadR family transcriptional regulator [Pseudomonadales bacterium]MDC1299067.1 FadR family transcriptional regulator [Pseudomonadales bacterium]